VEFGENGTFEPLDLKRTYTVACPIYLTSGKDGYTQMQNLEYVIDEERSVMLSVMLRRHWMDAMVINKIKFIEEDAIHKIADQMLNRRYGEKNQLLQRIINEVEGRITSV